MVESLKLFVRTYTYWVGLILGFAIVPGSLLFTGGVAPVSTPLWLAPLAGLLLFIIDRPSTWETPLCRALLIRVLGTGVAAIALVAFDTVASTSMDLNIGVRRSYLSVSAGLPSRSWQDGCS